MYMTLIILHFYNYIIIFRLVQLIMANSYITVASNSSNDVKEEFAQMYREHGLEGLVKEVSELLIGNTSRINL